MSLRLLSNLVAAILLGCIGLGNTYPTISADNAGIVFICVDPNLLSDTDDSYLISFKTTQLLGFIPSEPSGANITIYSTEQAPVLATIYHIHPDAQSGGYRRIEKVGTAFTTSDLAINRPCSDKFDNLITSELESTFPLPLSQNQAVLMKVNAEATLGSETSFADEHLLDTADFLGNAAFRFISRNTEIEKSFHFSQLDTQAIDLTFPFIGEDSDFVVLSNKGVTLRLSTADTPEDFVLGRGSFSYQRLSNRLIDDFEQNLYQIMLTGGFQIYPAEGILEVYETGGAIRLEMTDTIAQRDPVFLDYTEEIGNQRVKPLEIPNMTVEYILVADDSIRRTISTNDSGTAIGNFQQLRVKGVNEKGELIVTQMDNEDEAVVQTWLVEIVPP